MELGDKIKINKKVFEQYVRDFKKDKKEILKKIKLNEIYEVIYYKKLARNPAEKMCQTCSLKDECDNDVLDFKSNDISVWCAKLFKKVEDFENGKKKEEKQKEEAKEN